MGEFGCLHKTIDAFLHNCANAIWILKGIKGPPFYLFIYFSLTKKFSHIAKGYKHPPS
jgi:hypothetical protein